MLRRDDEFEIDTEYEGKSAGYAGDLSSAAQRQRALEQQKARALQKQQMRRGQSGAIQTNRGFTGASRTISSNRARTFSAPKTIDPLEGEDDEDRPTGIKRTGYAENFRGSSRNVSAGYGGVYESLHPRVPESTPGSPQQMFDHRIANVETSNNQQARFSHPNEVEDEAKEELPSEVTESKIDHSQEKRRIPTYSISQEEEEEVQKKVSSKNRTTKSRSSKSASAGGMESAAISSAAASKSSRTSKQLKPKRSIRIPDEEEEEEEEVRVSKPRQKLVDEEEEEELPRPSKTSSKRRESLKEEEKTSRRSSSRKDMLERRDRSLRAVEKPAKIPVETEDEIHDDREPKSSEDEYDSIERPLASKANPSAPAFDFSDMRSFLTSPIPKSAGTVQCYIERSKNGSNRLFPEYQLFLKEGDRFLMAAKKRAKNRTSNYAISMDPNDLAKSSGNFIGKLRSNFIGTEFQIFDHGANPKNADPDSLHVKATPVREELGAILYASNVLGSRGPRKMKVAIPLIKKDGTRSVFRPTRKNDELLTHFKERDMSNVLELVNKPPRWNDHVSAFVLNFNGRVTMASVKNFQLISPEDEDAILLQFGRVGKDLFTADLAWPLSPLQAFAICLSSFDSKLACE